MMLLDLGFRLKVGLRRDAESKSVVAYCPALDLYSAGETDVAAQAAIVSALKLYLEACWERGQFEAAMRRAHFHPVTGPADLAAAKSAEFVAIRESLYDMILDVDVPFPLVSRENTACLH